MMKTTSFPVLRRATLLAAIIACLSALSCSRGGGGLGTWPEKSITPPAGSKIVKVLEVNGMWHLYFDSALSIDEVRSDLESKLSSLGWLEVPEMAGKAFSYTYVAPDGLSDLALVKPPKTPPMPGLWQFDYYLSLKRWSSPSSMFKHGKPLAPAGD